MALVSIVIPVYYNAPGMPALAGRLTALAAAQPKHQFEFVCPDDGSGDNSFAVVKEPAERDSRIRAVKGARNFGSNTAILAGMTYAQGDCAGFIAADLQNPPEALPKMVAPWQGGHKVIWATR
jgi:glycosyltransferase involved in cell wall biosynthesis